MRYASQFLGRLGAASWFTLLAGDCPKKPPVTDIEIVPYAVVVGPDANPTTFELEARLWTDGVDERRSITESEGHDLTWEVSPQTWLTLEDHSGFRAKFSIASGAAPTTPAFVKVKAGGKTTTPGAEISVAPNALTGKDVLTATYTGDKMPDAVVVNGVRNTPGGPCEVTLSAFVTRSPLGQVVDECPPGDDAAWEAAVLSTNHKLTFVAEEWASPPPDDTPDARPDQGSLRTLPIALRVMVGNSSLSADELATLRDDVLKIAQADIQATNSILAETRTGIELTLQETVTIDAPEVVEVGDCRSGDTETSSKDLEGLLNVYYVNALAGERGRACAWHDGRKHDVIYIGREDHSVATLVHEIGHTLGLMVPRDGHPEIVEGFDRTNVMTRGYDDTDPSGRHRLSIGQVFRMNADSSSWLNRGSVSNAPLREVTAPRLACQCGGADPAGRCPRLIDDVARPSDRPNTTGAWDCSDMLQLKTVVEADDESPVAIAAGRRWRAPPGTCSTDLPGRTEKHFSATYVALDNLTRPGSCRSWVAIFFRRHGLLYRELAEPDVTWTQAADEVLLVDGLTEPVEVTVHVFTPPNQNTVDDDAEHAGETFGESNWSGVKLTFETQAATEPCQQPSLPLTISLCYDTGGTDEGSVPHHRTVRVSLGKRTETTVSHFLGQALGLEQIATGTSGFPDNIMRADPADRGENLTLGQVYRINASLNTSLPCDPGTCPSLEADVAR